MTEWPYYESHKVVQAAKIVRVEEIERNSGTTHVVAIWVKPSDDAPEERFQPTHQSMHDVARVGGWAMLYPDGFKSISPAKAFEEGYTRRE